MSAASSNVCSDAPRGACGRRSGSRRRAGPRAALMRSSGSTVLTSGAGTDARDPARLRRGDPAGSTATCRIPPESAVPDLLAACGSSWRTLRHSVVHSSPHEFAQNPPHVSSLMRTGSRRSAKPTTSAVCRAVVAERLTP